MEKKNPGCSPILTYMIHNPFSHPKRDLFELVSKTGLKHPFIFNIAMVAT